MAHGYFISWTKPLKRSEKARLRKAFKCGEISKEDLK